MMNKVILHILLISAVFMPWALARRLGEADSAGRKLKEVIAATRGAIPGQYLVLLEDDVEDIRGALNGIINANDNAKITRFYESVFKGVMLSNVPDPLVQRLLNSPVVKEVYEDAATSASVTQPNAPWGLDRIDARIGLDGNFNYNLDGSGVDIYVLDTGAIVHPDYSARYKGCVDYTGEGCTVANPNRHGTHVAGTAVGTTYGVAKGAGLYDYKVLASDGSGSFGWAISAVDDITAIKQQNPCSKIVINMSLGGGKYDLMNMAVDQASAAGVVVVVAAGNESTDACTTSPASAVSAITVGATTSSDQISSFSNTGSCVDIYAPGSDILSTAVDGGSITLSGTSMASPHVAGVAALYLEANKDPRVEMIADATTLPSTIPFLYINVQATDPPVGICAPATANPTNPPTAGPTKSPTKSPTQSPTKSPTKSPTTAPTKSPTPSPTKAPTKSPTLSPTKPGETQPPTTASPTMSPTKSPTKSPTISPTKSPTISPTKSPTISPTKSPTISPTKSPTISPTKSPTMAPTKLPTPSPTKAPTKSPTLSPTKPGETLPPTTAGPTAPSTPTIAPTPSSTITVPPDRNCPLKPNRELCDSDDECCSNKCQARKGVKMCIGHKKSRSKRNGSRSRANSSRSGSSRSRSRDNSSRSGSRRSRANSYRRSRANSSSKSMSNSRSSNSRSAKKSTRKNTKEAETTRPPATKAPTNAPTTNAPTNPPTNRPTKAPTNRPTNRPTTSRPTNRPTTSKPTNPPLKCLSRGAACSKTSDCCSGKCTGKKGKTTCSK